MTRKANIMVTDGTREHVSLLSRQYGGEPRLIAMTLADYIHAQHADSRHGRQRLKLWTALTANVTSSIEGMSREASFEPLKDCSYLYVLDTTAMTFSGFWCMSTAIPAEQYLLAMEKRPRMTICLAKCFELPFSGTDSAALAVILDEKKRLVEGRHAKLADMKELKKFVGEVKPFGEYLEAIGCNG